MADKPVLGTIAGGAVYSATKINTLLDTLATAIEGCLGRGGVGESPNSMSANFDMNSNNIINLKNPAGAQHAATKAYVDAAVLAVDESTITAAQVLSLLLGVDGAGSGLDADTLDGNEAVVTATADTVALRANDGDLYAVDFHGDLIGDVTGDVTGNVSGQAGSSKLRGCLATTDSGADTLLNSTISPLFFDHTTFDTDTMWSSGSAQYINIPATPAVQYVRITAYAEFQANATGYRELMIYDGATPVSTNEGFARQSVPSIGASAATHVNLSCIVKVPASAALNLRAFQSSGITLGVPEFSMSVEILGDLYA